MPLDGKSLLGLLSSPVVLAPVKASTSSLPLMCIGETWLGFWLASNFCASELLCIVRSSFIEELLPLLLSSVQATTESNRLEGCAPCGSGSDLDVAIIGEHSGDLDWVDKADPLVCGCRFDGLLGDKDEDDCG